MNFILISLTTQFYCLCAYSSGSELYCKYQGAYTFSFLSSFAVAGALQQCQKVTQHLPQEECPCACKLCSGPHGEIHDLPVAVLGVPVLRTGI